MMQSVLGNSSKILIDQKNSANLLSLPLDKLLQQGTAASAAAAAAGSESPNPPPRVTTTPDPVAIDPSRPREGLPNREGRCRPPRYPSPPPPGSSHPTPYSAP